LIFDGKQALAEHQWRPAIIRPVILCGGAGTRLWPVSRQTFPKQLLPVAGDRSLLQQTASRLSGQRFAPAIVVSGEDQRFFIKRQLEAAGAPVESILLEPSGRNTSAAAGLAASWLLASGRDDLLLLMPSDHVIGDRDAFLKAIDIGAPHAEQGSIVTFGATPTAPNTQYGYIEADMSRPSPDGAYPIARFVEKPSAGKAAEYLSTGRFFWNAGIFLAKTSTLIDEMRRFLPESLDAISRSVKESAADGLFVRPAPVAFNQAENISIDHGLMEKTSRGVVVPVQMQWSDVGSWDAIWALAAKDGDGNVSQGEVISIDTKSSLLRSDDGALIAAVGLDRMAVIAVRDAVFVAPLDRVSDVRHVVEALKGHERDRLTSPAKVARPWGSYETVAEGPGFQVKHIVVDPGERLSLQSHVHRSEHWVVVRGAAEVTVGDSITILRENESSYIPAGTVHRLANPGTVPLELIEIQCGSYLGEDDIRRFDDEYGRAETKER
jgi:mannose-1-phosphate guanylyltransferase/mannose-6-phosphate isomerase